jgi:hypothetical protein
MDAIKAGAVEGGTELGDARSAYCCAAELEFGQGRLIVKKDAPLG